MEREPRLTPFRVQKFLGGLRYPACKRDVLGRAQEKGADARVLRALERLPEGEFASPIELSRRISV